MNTYIYISRIFLLSIAFLCITSCATYKSQAVDIESLSPNLTAPYDVSAVKHEFILTGDLAANRKSLNKKMIQLLEDHLNTAGPNSTLLLLGDNIRSFSPSQEKKAASKQPITALFPILEKYKGSVHILPGELEWKKFGQPGVEAIEDWIQDELSQDDIFFVDDGCPGPETREISDKLVLISFDSQWLLQDWDGHRTYNYDCDIRNKEWFELQLIDEINNYARTHNVILAMHHPVMSKGRHGGYRSWKDHLFPFRNKHKHIPVPIPGLGSIITFFDQRIGSRQDLSNPVYLEYSDFIDDLRRDYPGMIVVSGHENNLQYLENKGQHYIVSSSFQVNCPAKLDDEAKFVSGERGISKLIVMQDGAVWLEFFNEENQLLYRHKIKSSLPKIEELLPDTFIQYEKLEDSVTAIIATDDQAKKYSTFWWGELYTDEYYRPIKIPVLDLEKEKGGLQAFRRGGGFQTINIRLRDSVDQLYHIRSLQKSAQKLLPFPFNKTFATNIARKQLTAANPFGAFLLSPMMEAIGIYHTNPKLVYVPKQTNLGRYNPVGNQIYLFEERADEDWRSLSSFGNSKEIISHTSMREEIFDDVDHYSDQPFTLRTRLFDMLIGDWDRHDDQWRWATFEDEENGKTVYQVIPRDRDQAFAKYGGIIPNLIRTTFPFVRSTQKFSDDISDDNIKWINRQARNFDRLHLNELTWEDWKEQINHIQTHLTDEVIDTAMNILPSEVIATGMGERLGSGVKSRRDKLERYARIHYEYLYKEVDVVGTHDDNIFVIERQDDQSTRIRVYEKDDDQEKVLYDRIFETDITKEIRCYGLDGDDSFYMSGEVHKGPLIRYIGGNGEDIYSDRSKVRGLAKKNKIYDTEKGKFFNKTSETKLRISKQYHFNHYDYKNHFYDFAFAYPLFGFNPDDGFSLSLNIFAHLFGFKKHQTHLFTAAHAFGSDSYSFDYQGVYFNALGKSDMTLDVSIQEPRFVSNYFGLGNESEKVTDNIDFYRYRSSRIYINPAYRLTMSDERTFFFVGPTFESVEIDYIQDRYLAGDGNPINPSVFSRQRFLGLNAGFSYNTIENTLLPVRGIEFTMNANATQQINKSEQRQTTISSDFSWYQPLDNQSRILFATRIGAAHTIGDFYFFQANQIGGNNNLRGFRAQRFSGRTTFYHNNDLRIALLRARTAGVPFTLGILGGFDYGRVWQDDEESNKWHTGYGGGIWIAPINYFVLSTSLFMSEEETRFQVRFGFHF